MQQEQHRRIDERIRGVAGLIAGVDDQVGRASERSVQAIEAIEKRMTERIDACENGLVTSMRKLEVQEGKNHKQTLARMTTLDRAVSKAYDGKPRSRSARETELMRTVQKQV